MSVLLDKMGYAKNKQDENRTLDQESVRPAGPTDPNLEDTQPTPVSRPMTFTYPTGSKPLPQYTIRRGIGMGGFGEVYFAVSEAGKEVAIKRIQRNLEVELRGASHCLNLKHPNLVSLHDICRDESEQSWVVMEYIAGPNLREVLDTNPNGLSESEVRRWFLGIASGVTHLHSAGLVHRDLKPGNVFDDLGIVKVGDYGLSKFISASHRGGHTESVGTFHYMAPEIGRGEYGREIDVYALGILLYELLTGEVPFDGESCHEIIVKHLTATPDLSQVASPYRQVIAKALEKEPSKRHSNVQEMLVELGLAEASSVPQSIGAAPMTSKAKAELVEPVARFVNVEPVSEAVQSPASRSTDEPLARAVRQSIGDLKQWWNTLDQSPRAKTALMILAAFILIVNTSWLLPLLSVIAIFYVPYYIIRQMVLHVQQQPTYAQAQRIASAAGYVSKPLTKRQWRSHMRNDLRAKRSIHRMAELSTSWMAAVLTIIGMTLGAGMIGLQGGPGDAVAASPYGWMLAVILLGSVGILGMGKLWERDEGEGLPRRLVLAGLGAGVGFAAYHVGDFLMFLPDAVEAGMVRRNSHAPLPPALYKAGSPKPVAFMAHFALLFAAIRWWKPVDPLRRTRLSLWSVACIVVVAWFIQELLPIPQPYGMLIAGGIAIAVQMAAPWIDPRRANAQQATTPRPTYPREQSEQTKDLNSGSLI